MDKNISVAVQGDNLVITVKGYNSRSVKAAPLSKTGKSNLLATTHGYADAPAIGGVPMAVSLNVIAMPNKAAAAA